jgi:hypothetical protein
MSCDAWRSVNGTDDEAETDFRCAPISGWDANVPLMEFSLGAGCYCPIDGMMEIKLKDVIKREFKRRGESVNSVASSCGIPQSTLHNWAQGVLPNAKNLHHVKTLSDYLRIPLVNLLFDVKDENFDSAVLFSSTFVDADRRYRLVIEKLPK